MASMRASIELAAKKKGFLAFDEMKGHLGKVSSESARTRKELQQLNRRTAEITQSFNQAVRSVRNFALGLGAGMGLAEAVKQSVSLADAYKNMNARLSLATASQQAFNTAQVELFAAAQNAGVKLEEVSGLYTNIAPALRELGKTQKEVLVSTDLITKSLSISGSSATESSSAITQLTQALGSGVLRGEEFNSIMENGRGIAMALADGLGVPIGALRNMAQEGQLTADVVITALLSQEQVINEKFAQMPLTVDQAMTRVRNSMFQTVGQLEERFNFAGTIAAGISSLTGYIAQIIPVVDEAATEVAFFLDALKFSDEAGFTAIRAIGDAFAWVGDKIIPILPYLAEFATGAAAVIASALGLSAVAGAFSLIGSAIAAMGAILLANPIIAIVTAIGGAAYVIRENWEPIKAWWNDFWSVFSAPAEKAWSDLKTIVVNSDIAQTIRSAWADVPGYIKEPLNKVAEAVSQTWSHIQKTVEDQGYVQGSITLMTEFSAAIIKKIQSIPAEAQQAWADLQRIVSDSSFVTGALVVWEVYGPTVLGVLSDLKAGVFEVFESLSSAFSYMSADFSAISTELSQTLAVWMNWWSGESSETMLLVRNIFAIGWDWIKGIISGAWDIIKASIKAGWDFVTGILTVGLRILRGDWAGAWDAMQNTVVDFGLGILNILEKINEKIAGFVGRIKKAMVDAAVEVKAFFGLADGAAEAGQKMADGFVGPLPQIKTSLAGVGDAADKTTGSFLGNARALLEGMRAGAEYAEQNRELANQLGDNEAITIKITGGLKETKESTDAVTAATKERVIVEKNSAEELLKKSALDQQAAKFIKANMSAQDKYNATAKQAVELLQAEKITQEQFNSAIEKAAAVLDKSSAAKTRGSAATVKLTEAEKEAVAAAKDLAKAHEGVAAKFTEQEQRYAVLTTTLNGTTAAGRQLELQQESMHEGVMLLSAERAAELQQMEAANAAIEKQIQKREEETAAIEKAKVAATESMMQSQRAAELLRIEYEDSAEASKLASLADEHYSDTLAQQKVSADNLAESFRNKIAIKKELTGINTQLADTEANLVALQQGGLDALEASKSQQSAINTLKEKGIDLESALAQEYLNSTAALTSARATLEKQVQAAKDYVAVKTDLAGLELQLVQATQNLTTAQNSGVQVLENSKVVQEATNKLKEKGVDLESELAKKYIQTATAIAAKNKLLEAEKALQQNNQAIEQIEAEITATVKSATALADHNTQKEVNNQLGQLGIKIESEYGQKIESSIRSLAEKNKELKVAQYLTEQSESLSWLQKEIEATVQGKAALEAYNVEKRVHEQLTRLGIDAESDLGRQIAESERQTAAMEQRLSAVQELRQPIQQFFNDAFTSGKDAFSNLSDYLKDWLKQMIVEFATNKIMVSLGMAGSAGGKAGGGLLSGLTGLLGGGSSGGSGGGFLSGLTGLFGGGSGGASGGGGGLLGGIMGIFSGSGLGSLLGGGLLSLAAPLLGGLFGGKKEKTGSGFQVGYSSEGGVDGQSFDSYKKKKAFWGGTKRWDEYKELDSKVADTVGGFFENLNTTIVGQAEALGVAGADSILDSFSMATAKFTGENAEEDLKNWLKASTRKAYHHAFKDLDSDIKSAIQGGMNTMGQSTEEIAARFAYVAAVATSVKPALEALGLNIGTTFSGAVKNATYLTDALGGVDAALNTLSFYAQNFIPEGERISTVLDQATANIDGWNQTLGLTGDAAIDTKEEFRSYIESLDLTTVAGREAAAAAFEQMESVLALANANQIAKEKLDAVAQATYSLNLNFDPMSAGASDAAGALIDFMGGLEAFSAATSNYYDKFYSEAEKTDMIAAQSAAAVAAFNDAQGLTGDAAIDTAAEFRNYVESLDLTTEAGREAYAEAMKLADSMKAVADSGMQLDEMMANLPEKVLANAVAAQAYSDGLEVSATKTNEAAGSAEKAMALVETKMASMGSAANDAAGAVGSAATMIAGAVTSIEKALGKATAAASSAETAAKAAKAANDGGLPEFARGGITSGRSIAGEAGPEAVIPLPDGRSVPVSLALSDIPAINRVDVYHEGSVEYAEDQRKLDFARGQYNIQESGTYGGHWDTQVKSLREKRSGAIDASAFGSYDSALSELEQTFAELTNTAVEVTGIDWDNSQFTGWTQAMKASYQQARDSVDAAQAEYDAKQALIEQQQKIEADYQNAIKSAEEMRYEIEFGSEALRQRNMLEAGFSQSQIDNILAIEKETEALQAELNAKQELLDLQAQVEADYQAAIKSAEDMRYELEFGSAALRERNMLESGFTQAQIDNIISIEKETEALEKAASARASYETAIQAANDYAYELEFGSEALRVRTLLEEGWSQQMIDNLRELEQANEAAASASEANAAAIEAANAQRESEIDTYERLQAAAKTMRATLDDLFYDAELTLASPLERLEAARVKVDDLAAKAARDPEAAEALSGAVTDALKLSREYNASTQAYVDDYTSMTGILDRIAGKIESMPDPSKSGRGSSGPLRLSNGMEFMPGMNLDGTWVDGSHASGLASVPFDGYRAELHAGEMVLPASAANALRDLGVPVNHQIEASPNVIDARPVFNQQAQNSDQQREIAELRKQNAEQQKQIIGLLTELRDDQREIGGDAHQQREDQKEGQSESKDEIKRMREDSRNKARFEDVA